MTMLAPSKEEPIHHSPKRNFPRAKQTVTTDESSEYEEEEGEPY